MLRGRRKKGDGMGIKGPSPATPAMEDFSIAWVLNRWRLPGDEHAGFTSGSVWLKFVYGLLMQLTCKSTVGGILMVIVRVINLPKTMVTEMKTSSFETGCTLYSKAYLYFYPAYRFQKCGLFLFYCHTGQTCTLYSPHTSCVPQKFHPICDVIFHDKIKHGVAYFAPAFKTMFRSFAFHL